MDSRSSSSTTVVFAAILALLSGPAGAEMCDLSASVGDTLWLQSLCDTRSPVLSWTHNGSRIFHRERGRVSAGEDEDVSVDGCLRLKILRFSSAGVYQGQVQLANKTLVRSWSGRLCVTEKLAKMKKPQLVYKCDFSTSTVLLDCSVSPPQGLTFSWTLDRKPLSHEKGKTLNVSLSRLTSGGIFTCSASNRKDEEKADAIRALCVPPRPPPPPLCFASRSVVAVLAGGGASLLLLLVVVLALACSLRRTRRRLRDKGQVRMGSLQSLEAEPVDLEYETVHPLEESPTLRLEPSPQGVYLNVTDDPPARQPSPVPRPRTKAPLKQNQ